MSFKEKIHIVHITQHLEIGGLESFIVEFCRKLDKDAFTATVLCFNSYDELYKESLAECGVAVHLIRKHSRYDLLFLWRAAAFLKSIKADIVHSHGGCFLYSSLVGKLAGVKGLVHTAHGMPVVSGLQAGVEEFLSCSMTDRIVAVSDEVADDLKCRQKWASQKIDVIINGIDSDRYRPVYDKKVIADRKADYGLPANKKIIGTVGRLEPVKNYPLLLHACAKLTRSDRNDFHLVLVGSGCEAGALKSLADDLGIRERVTFLGMQYDLHKIYPLFDFFVLPSLTEGTSLSLLEAQSCGVTAVVTDVGGNSRVIKNGLNGFLTPSGDHDAMTAHLDRCLNCDTELAAMGKTARAEILDKFNIRAVLKQYQTMYCGLVKPEAVSEFHASRGKYDVSAT
jgi:glycosyltransferase involved in cell wall biosynthesis